MNRALIKIFAIITLDDKDNISTILCITTSFNTNQKQQANFHELIDIFAIQRFEAYFPRIGSKFSLILSTP